MDINGVMVEDTQEIATSFNDFFIEKVKKIDENIPETRKDPLEYTRWLVGMVEEDNNTLV